MAGIVKKKSKNHANSSHPQVIEQTNYAASLEIQPDRTQQISEDLRKVLRVLEFLMKHVRFSGHFQNELVQFLQDSSELPNFPEIHSTLYAMSDLGLCSTCKQEEFEVVTECNHPFCHSCYYSSVYEATNGLVCLNEQEMSKYCPSCPACSELLTLTDLAKADPGDWPQWQQKAETRLHRSPVRPVCALCNRSAVYCELDQCRHKCADCLYTAIRSGHLECSTCKSAYNWLDTLQTMKFQCEGCGSSTYVLSDYSFAVCEGHRLCFSCVQDSFNKQQCTVCSTKLDTQTLSAIEKAIFTQCEQCEVNVESFYFFPKDCCSRQICSICQYEDNGFKCKGCSAPLGSLAKTFLAELAKDLEELNRTEPSLFTL